MSALFITKRKKFWKLHLYRLPCALASEMFPCKDGRYYPTWGEWTRKIQKLCPFQYFFRDIMVDWFKTKRSHFIDIKWNVRCWLFPRNVIRAEQVDRRSGYVGDIIHYGLLQVVEDFLNSEYSKYYRTNKLNDTELEFWREINEAYLYLQLKESMRREDDMDNYCHWCVQKGYGRPDAELKESAEETNRTLGLIVKWRAWF